MPTRRTFLKSLGALSVLGLYSPQSISNGAITGLKTVYKDDFMIGSMIDAEHLAIKDHPAIKILKDQFSSISSANIFKWENIHPSEDRWNWVYSDHLVQLGERYGMHIYGHPLIWHSQLPEGLYRESASVSSPITKSTLIKRMRNHISTLVNRYSGRIHSWDVVNEAIDDNGLWVKNLWYQTIGWDYLSIAFEEARKSDKNAILVYNDYNLWKKSKRTKVLEVLDEINSGGRVVDAIGMQGHYHLDYPSLKDIEEALKDFTERGYQIYISELDIDVLPVISGNPIIESSSESSYYGDDLSMETEIRLSERYADLFSLFLKYRSHIGLVNLWGISDEYTWLNDFPVPGRRNHPLLYNRNYEPKLAHDVLINLKKG